MVGSVALQSHPDVVSGTRERLVAKHDPRPLIGRCGRSLPRVSSSAAGVRCALTSRSAARRHGQMNTDTAPAVLDADDPMLGDVTIAHVDERVLAHPEARVHTR